MKTLFIYTIFSYVNSSRVNINLNETTPSVNKRKLSICIPGIFVFVANGNRMERWLGDWDHLVLCMNVDTYRRTIIMIL